MTLTENPPPKTKSNQQHSHVFTIGKRPSERNILSHIDVLSSIGAEVRKATRGGDVTYHGPGQTVLYPIVGLRNLNIGVRRYVEGLEDVMVDTCEVFGVEAFGRVPEMTGTWVRDHDDPENPKKIGAVGVQISGGVTTHGLAFNLDPDLEYFKHIMMCGLPGKQPTSLVEEIGKVDSVHRVIASRAEVEAKLVQSFVGRFGYEDVSMVRE